MAYTNQSSSRPLLHEEETLNRSRRMNTKKRKLGMPVALLMLALPLCAVAQDEEEHSQGSVRGGYIVQQTVEFGGRISNVNGNGQLYDTLINLKSGPRLLGQDLSMRSITPGGGLFDNLYLSSFGFGGDPNNMARLRVEKSKWYNFVALYRRDENFFDYNLFANPLNLNQGIGAALKAAPGAFNPATMSWFVNSPHLQDTTRNMGDFNLTLFPQSAVRIRLNYARNVNAGRLDTTLEAPVQSILTEFSQSRSDRYQFGIDIRVMKRTTLSFDQFFEHDKVDPNFTDNNLAFTLQNGTPVDVGISFPARGCTPVAGVTFPGNNVFVPGGACNVGLFGFNRSGQVRTDIPTSQLSLQSNYFRKLDITVSGTYSSGRSDFLNFQEFADTVKAPASLITANTHTDRVSGNADLGLTYHLSRSWSVSEKFRWLDWRDPGNLNQSAFNCTATPGSGLTASGAGCTTLSSATSISTLLAERTYYNTAKLNWTSRRLGAYVGYRYGRRELTGAPVGDSPTLNSYFSIGVDTPGEIDAPRNITKINEHTALVGVVLRPTIKLRINTDLELLSADNAFTNVGPRNQQRVRANATYAVNHWASVTGGVHFIETRNSFGASANSSPDANPANPNLFPTTGASTVPGAYGHKDHWRYFTVGATLHPNRQFGFDFGWTYLDQLINSATCVPLTGLDATATPALCNGFNKGGLPLVQDYQERTNSGYANLTFRPVHRVTLLLGYELTSTAGHNRWLLPGGSDGSGSLLVTGDIFGNSPPLVGNPITPCPSASAAVALGCAFPGPFADAPLSQALNWHKPTLGVAIDFSKSFTFKFNHSYYDYNEKETQGLPLVTLPRNFHANNETISLKYAF
jgi:hypothetical protein